MQSCCSHAPGVGSIDEGQDYLGDAVSHEGSTHQDDSKYNRSPHTQRFWIVSDDRHTVGEHHGSSSCGTPESNVVWKLSHTAHICRVEYLQKIKKEKRFTCITEDIFFTLSLEVCAVQI